MWEVKNLGIKTVMESQHAFLEKSWKGSLQSVVTPTEKTKCQYLDKYWINFHLCEKYLLKIDSFGEAAKVKSTKCHI